MFIRFLQTHPVGTSFSLAAACPLKSATDVPQAGFDLWLWVLGSATDESHWNMRLVHHLYRLLKRHGNVLPVLLDTRWDGAVGKNTTQCP